MSLYQKMRLLFKASAEAPMRQLVASNDILIFEQEIADFEKVIKSAKLHLSQIKTEAKLTEATIAELKTSIETRESQALEVIDKDQVLAEELACLIAEDEKLLNEQQLHLSQLKKLDIKIMSDIKSAVRVLQNHRHKLSFLKANQHSLQANKSIKSYGTGLKTTICELNNSLECISERQLRCRLLEESESEIEDSVGNVGIDKRLKEAGVNTNDASQFVMQRLLARKDETRVEGNNAE